MIKNSEPYNPDFFIGKNYEKKGWRNKSRRVMEAVIDKNKRKVLNC